MKKLIIPAIAALAVSGVQAKSADARIKELESRLEALEYKSYENYFSFGGRLENQYEFITAKDNNTDDEAGHEYFSTLFQLDVSAQPNDELSFYGRLSMAKYWNDIQVEGEYDDTSLSLGRAKGDATPYVERAFINYKMLPSLTLSAGRLPTVDGTPTHYRMGQSSMGSYPVFSYSTTLDGIALTHGASVLGGTLTSRVVYSPITFANHGVGKRTSPVETKDSSGRAINTQSPMAAAMVGYEKYNTSFADRFEAFFQAVHLNQVEVGSQNDKDTDGYFDSFASDLNFDLTKVLATIELNNIFKSKFDFAAQVAWSEVKSEGTVQAYPLLSDGSGAITTISDAAVVGMGLGNLGGIYTGSNEGTSTGWAYLASLRYNATNKFKLGYEYIQSTSKAFMMTETSRRATSFYSTPGSQGHHGYMNYRLNDNLSLLGGYTYQKVNTSYTQGLFGDPSAHDHTVQSVYTNLIATF